MPDNQEFIYSELLSDLENLNISDTYDKTTWTDGSYPPLDAQHLQNIEDALARIFLSSTSEPSEQSIIGKLVTAINDILNACKDSEDKNNTNLETLKNRLEDLKQTLEGSKLSISDKYKDITNVSKLLEEVGSRVTTHNNTTTAHTDIRKSIASLESTMPKNYIKTTDNVIHRINENGVNDFT